MRLFRRVINPFVAFIGIQLAWVLVVVFWVYWFMGTSRQLRALAERYSPELLKRGAEWVILVEGLILLAAILVGVYVIFLYWKRQTDLYRAQRNFISQVTHELKSPLASLRLHLETIRLREPDPEQLESFLETMDQDAERLDGLINNLLSASRLEQRAVRLELQRVNLSQLVTEYFAEHRSALPSDGKLRVDVEPNLFALVEPESIEVVFRNLLENAVLYADGPPEVAIALAREGKHAHLTFADRGKGLDKRHHKKVFSMFYRVRRSGEGMRGSGLGLFIVRTIVRRHRGRIWLESEGAGRGVDFHVLIPLCEEEG